MPTEQEVASASRALAVGLSMIAAFLGLSQWYDRKARGDTVDSEDVRHFARQDRRRWTGVAALITISLASLSASFTSSRVDGRGNPVFIVLWLGILGLLLLLMVLASGDWLATRRFERRHRKQLLRESIEAVRNDRLRRGLPSRQDDEDR